MDTEITQTITEKIMDLLKPYNNPDIPIKDSAVLRLDTPGRDEFYNFLVSTETRKTEDNVPRPSCPVTNENSPSRARAPYKLEMDNYISQWGYSFYFDAVNITPSLLEATANYLEKRK